MSLSTMLLNVSPMTAGTRTAIKSCLEGTAVSPLLPMETSGALQMQICSHHAKMQPGKAPSPVSEAASPLLVCSIVPTPWKAFCMGC